MIKRFYNPDLGPRPWRTGEGEEAGFIFDASGNLISQVSTDVKNSSEAALIAKMIVVAVNSFAKE